MKKLDEQSLEVVVGGKLTKQERADFLGAAACTSVVMGFGGILGILGCADWIF